MDAKELRIGNWINVGGNTIDTYQIFKPAQVTIPILKEILEENNERPNAVLSVFMPIPITRDMCLDWGFYNDLGSLRLDVSSDYNAGFEFWDDKLLLVDGDGGNIGNVIKYVHNFQNIYYAIHGKEPIINL